MTEESEWPDEVTADEPETELEVENESTQSSDDNAGNNPSEQESVVSESHDEEEKNQLITRRMNLLMSRKNRVLQMILE